MALRYRPMRKEDVGKCVEIVATNPVIGPRYGTEISNLRSAWRRLVGCEAMRAVVYEEVNAGQITLGGMGVGIFVHDDFIREIKTPPLFWFGPALAKRIMQGDSLVLSDKEVRDRNSKGGLNLLVWEACHLPEFATRPDVFHLNMTSFHALYRGYLCKEAITTQAESAGRLYWAMDAGGMLWNLAKGRYEKSLGRDVNEVFMEPHIVGITPDVELSRPGSWVGTIFDYHRPQLGFTRSEQQLLLSALPGRTDEELSEELGTSITTIKSVWRSIHNRTASRLPELFPGPSFTGPRNSERGRERRRHLLAYLREHLEELRPVSRKLLQEASTRKAATC